MKEAAMAGPIADAKRRSRPAGAPLSALLLLDAADIEASRVRPVWDAMPVTAQRELVAWLCRLQLGPVVVRVSQYAQPAERLEIVAARISVEWNRPGS
jgi:hypothetical protein